MNTIFKKEITIHDLDGKRFDLEITNEGTGPDNRYFSICSQSGQGQFKPKSDLQKTLLYIWDTFHLNGMSSGTRQQDKLVKEMKLKDDYVKAKDYLSKHKLDGSELSISEYERSNKSVNDYIEKLAAYESFKNNILKQLSDNDYITFNTVCKIEQSYFDTFVDLLEGYFVLNENKLECIDHTVSSSRIIKETIYRIDIPHNEDIYISAFIDEYKGKPFIYGHGWTYEKFPENFQEDLFKLIDDLIEEEETYSLKKITIDDLNNEEFIQHANDNCEGQVEKLMAACLKEGIFWMGLENITSNNGDCWDVEGFEYYIYTDEEANDAHLESIKNLVDDIGWEGFNGGNNIDVDMDTDGSITISKSISIYSNERGNALAGYDGREHEILVNGTQYYLYRWN